MSRAYERIAVAMRESSATATIVFGFWQAQAEECAQQVHRAEVVVSPFFGLEEGSERENALVPSASPLAAGAAAS